MTAAARARARERGQTLAPPAAKRGVPWLPVVLVSLTVAAGAAIWLLRPQRPPAPAAPAVAPPPEADPRSYHLVVDPSDATVEIDHVLVTERDLPIDSDTPRSHHVKVAAPGRVSRSFSFIAKPGMKLLLRLGRTLPPPSPTDPAPLSAELAITLLEEPPHADEITQAFAKLQRYAGCLALLGFAEGDNRKAGALGRPRPDHVARCQTVVQESALKWPKLPALEAAGSAFIAAAFADETTETLARLTVNLRAEFLAARTFWQTHELARLGKDEGRKAGWHLRRVALAAQAWVRARKAGAKAAEPPRARFETSLDELGRYPKDEMVRVAGASIFTRHAQELLALGRSDKRASEAAMFETCRKLFADFEALVLE